ncbi:hypothetical protein [Streptomyces sp. NBC_01451]|uniref:hypothetical protein n=1 Tax=Streptomyces sp. NBC_01451 TaxID=2903872 RepID=UPI002E339B26|nr:hypothetical protein [Streptomyces sp. NBC_01451]
MTDIPADRGMRFVYIYADRNGPHDPTPEDQKYFVGKLLTANREVADLAAQLLGARTSTGRRVSLVEIGKPDKGAVIESVHTSTVHTTPET